MIGWWQLEMEGHLLEFKMNEKHLKQSEPEVTSR